MTEVKLKIATLLSRVFKPCESVLPCLHLLWGLAKNSPATNCPRNLIVKPFVVLIEEYLVEKVFLNSSSEMSAGRSATQMEYSRSE